MADRISAQFDPRSLDRLGNTIAFYAQGLNKDTSDVSNRALRQIAIFASAKTPAADPNKIEAEMRKVVAHQVFSKGKSFKRLKKAKAITKRTRLANAIVWARARANGEELTSAEAERRAQKMTASRKKAVKFIRAGYIPALEATGARRLDAGKQRGQPKGTAKLATPRRIEAMLSNRVQGKTGGAAVKVGESALKAAIPEVERDMRQYAERKIAERTARANAAR